MEKKFIGLDLGAESGRCVVAAIDNGRVILHEVHRFTTHNVRYNKYFHWDILAIFQEIITGLRNACRIFGSHFDGIAVDTWGVDYVLVDSEGRIVGYPYHYRDSRTDGMMEEAFRILPKKRMYEKVGTQFAQFNTIFQLLSEKRRRSSFFIVADKMLLVPDFFSFLLSGVKRSEYTNASTTGLLNPATGDWSWDIIDALELPRRIFPEIVKPGTVLGPITPEISEETGLNPDVPVIATASHDTASAVVSIPALEPHWGFLSSGTWSLMGIELKEPVLSDKAMRYNFTNEGGVEHTIRFLKNIIGLWPIQECKRYWQEEGRDYSYPDLVKLAEASGFAQSWVDLGDPRFLKLGEMPEKILFFLRETGQPVRSDVGFVIRVVLESLAFSYRETMRQLNEVTGKKVNVLHVVGGGIQNELLTQLTADAIGCTVIAGPVEGTIIGNIGVQAIASEVVPDLHSWRGIVANSFELKEYNPINREYFDENEENFRRIMNREINLLD